MLNKKWVVLALLVGNILLVSITAGNPMYTRAVLQRTLTRNLETYLVENNAYPGLITIRTSGASKDGVLLRQYSQRAQIASERFGLPAAEQVNVLNITAAQNELLIPREDAADNAISLGMMTDLPEHSELVAGEFYSEAGIGEDGVLDAVLSERALIELNLLLGDEMVFPEVLDPQGNPIRIRIAGVFRNRSNEDIYWVRTPSSYQDICFIAPALFEEYFLQGDEFAYGVNASYYVMLDYTAMRGDEARQYLDVADAYRAELNGRTIQNYRDNFTATLTDYLEIAQKVNVTLWVLQTPIFALLAAFIFMVARQMLEMEQNEIAVIKSRGARTRPNFYHLSHRKPADFPVGFCNRHSARGVYLPGDRLGKRVFGIRSPQRASRGSPRGRVALCRCRLPSFHRGDGVAGSAVCQNQHRKSQTAQKSPFRHAGVAKIWAGYPFVSRFAIRTVYIQQPKGYSCAARVGRRFAGSAPVFVQQSVYDWRGPFDGARATARGMANFLAV